jgi:hypothetical protein
MWITKHGADVTARGSACLAVAVSGLLLTDTWIRLLSFSHNFLHCDAPVQAELAGNWHLVEELTKLGAQLSKPVAGELPVLPGFKLPAS